MAKVTIKQRGGDKLNRLFREAMKGGVKNVKVGFFSTPRYDDKKHTPVAAVAAWNEFGTNSIPERPFFRSALEEAKPKVIQTLKAEIDPKKDDRRPADRRQDRRRGRRRGAGENHSLEYTTERAEHDCPKRQFQNFSRQRAA